MSAATGAVSRVDKHGFPIGADLHVHKPCGHKDRCISAKGGCPKCASVRDRTAEAQRNERKRQQQVSGR